MNRFLLVLTFLLSAFFVQAQNNKEYFNIEGIIQVEDGTPNNVKIFVSRDGKGKKSTITQKQDGKYTYELDFQGEYTFEFSLEGYLTKTIKVNTIVPKEVLEDGIMPFFMDIFLYKEFNGSKNETVTVSFNDREYAFRYDKPYMQTIKAQKLIVEQLKAGNDLELQANYDAAIKKGDNFFKSKEYQNAKDAYLEALKLKSSELYPKNKIADIDRILSELALKEQQEKDLQAKYDAAIIKGDNAFKINDYTTAKEAFNEALTLKPKEQYPIQKLSEIQRILDELAMKDANLKALNDKYNTAIKKGDDAYNKKDYTNAQSGYNEALSLKPDEKYPQERLDEINRILNELALKEQQDKELNLNYDAAITKGDNALKIKDYTNARSFYQQALTLKPNETYPKSKIDEIDRTINELTLKEQQNKELQDKYNAAIVKGDDAFNSGDYTSARDAFTEASGYKPTEQYPKTKLSEIQKILGDLALKEQQEKDLKAKYDTAIKNGDDAFAKQDYKNARTFYSDAVKLKSNEQYPKDKLAEVEKILTELAQKEADQKALNDKYNAYIKQGDVAFSNKKYDDAKTAYNDALGLKPSEQYPKDRLSEIEKILNEIALKEQQNKDLQAKYDAAVSKGDAALNSGDYITAKDAYQEASTLKPTEKYPKDKIAEINRILAEIAQKEANEKTLNEKYDAAIKKGDELFTAKDYSNAKISYNLALTLKSGEAYPKSKIDEIDRILAEIAQKEAAQKELDTKYSTAIKSADDALKRKEYENAKTLYNDALTLKPNEQYPKDKIAEIEKTLAEIALKEKQERELKEKYDAAILNGDNTFNKNEYAGAKKYYEEALGLKPNEKYPKDKITQIDKILAEIALKDKQERELNEKYDAAIKKGDAALANKQYTDAKTAYNEASGLKPKEEYPKAKIKEIDDILAEIARLEALEKEKKEKYDAAIKKGDELFKNNQLLDAKSSYQEALTFKPEETYPQDQIKEIDRLEEERKKREEEARIQAELERLRKLNNVTVIEDENARQEALKKGERQALGGGGYVVLKPYGSIEALGSKYYGYINFGGGANIEITKEEFDKYKVMFNK